MPESPRAWRDASTVKTTHAPSGVHEILVPALTILWHPDVRRVGERALLARLGRPGGEVELSRLEPLFAAPEDIRRPDPLGHPAPLIDPHISRRPTRLVGAEDGAVRILDPATRIRATPVGRSVDGGIAFTVAELDAGVILLLADRVALVLHRLPSPPPRPPRYGLVGDSAAMLDLRRQIERVAPLDVPVLLRGATGSGKELVARAIHDAGPRRERACVAVNLAAVPASLAASELFGVAKGAFTGADHPRPGFFRQAERGTLFLDEIGECPVDVQVPLLRALESGEIQPVGAERPQRVDTRLIAATDADLESAIADGKFRAPLLHRLAGFEIRLPGLAERRDDIGRLLAFFLRRELAELGAEERLAPSADPRTPPWLGAPLVARLAAAAWPGNVRQLRNLARQLAITHQDHETVELNAQLEALAAAAEAEPGEDRAAAKPARERAEDKAAAPERPSYRDHHDVGEDELLAALEKHRWHLRPAAEELGVSRTSLYALIDKSPNLRTAAELGEDEIRAALARHPDPRDAAISLRVSPQGFSRRVKEFGLR